MSFSLSIDEARQLLPHINFIDSLPTSGQKAAFKVKVNEKEYALKIYDPNSSLERVQREIRAMMLIDSPFVVNFEEFNLIITKVKTVTYSIEEFIYGDSLKSKIESGNTMNESEIIEFLKGILTGFIALKTNKLVHRDIKPGNIMLREDGTPIMNP